MRDILYLEFSFVLQESPNFHRHDSALCIVFYFVSASLERVSSLQCTDFCADVLEKGHGECFTTVFAPCRLTHNLRTPPSHKVPQFNIKECVLSVCRLHCSLSTFLNEAD